MNSFGAKLRHLRKQRDLSQEEVARQLGYSRVQVSNWEIERSEPDIATLNKLAIFYDVPVDYLTGTTSSSPVSTTVEFIGPPITNNDVLPPALAQRTIAALARMSPDRAEEIVQRIESAAELFPKETKDAPAKKMA